MAMHAWDHDHTVFHKDGPTLPIELNCCSMPVRPIGEAYQAPKLSVQGHEGHEVIHEAAGVKHSCAS